MKENTEKDIVQVLNPKTKKYVKIDRSTGEIVSHKNSKGPYKNIPVVKKKDVDKSPYKKRGKTTEEHKELLLLQLENSFGIVTDACKKLNIHRSTHYGWIKDDPEYKAKVESIIEKNIDFAESCLYKAMQDGSVTAMIFFLKTVGRRRGYIERLNVIDEKVEVNLTIDEDEE